MFLRLWNQRAVIDDRAAGNDIRAVIYRNSCGDETAVNVIVPGADLGELAGPAAYRILVTISARSSIKDRPESGAGIVVLLELGLVEHIGIARWLCNAVTDALRPWVLRQRGSIKTTGRFGWRLLCNTNQASDHTR